MHRDRRLHQRQSVEDPDRIFVPPLSVENLAEYFQRARVMVVRAQNLQTLSFRGSNLACRHILACQVNEVCGIGGGWPNVTHERSWRTGAYNARTMPISIEFCERN